MDRMVRKIGTSEGVILPEDVDVFLRKHGCALTADSGMVYQFVMDVAAGAVEEADAARWFRDFAAPRP